MVQGGPCCKSCGAERERLVSLLPESGDLEEWLEGLLACNHAEPQAEEHSQSVVGSSAFIAPDLFHHSPSSVPFHVLHKRGIGEPGAV